MQVLAFLDGRLRLFSGPYRLVFPCGEVLANFVDQPGRGGRVQGCTDSEPAGSVDASASTTDSGDATASTTDELGDAAADVLECILWE